MAVIHVEVTGDLAAVTTLGKQINFATFKSLNQTIERAQKTIISELDDEFILRGQWYTPGRRYGINAKFARVTKLEGSIGTAADWLLEAEGANQGIKKPDKGGQHLADPDIDHTRHGIRNPVPRGEKAKKLLANPSRSKAFKMKGKYGGTLVMQRVGLDSSGNIRQNARGRYLRGRGKNRQSKLVLKYVLRKSARVPHQPVITRWSRITFELHHASYFRQNLRTAIRTAKMK